MENLLLSLNIVCPVFLLIVLGSFLKKRGTMSPEFCSKASTLVFYWALPASLMKQVAESDMIAIFDLKFVLYTVLSATAVFLITWGLSLWIIRDKRQISAVVHAAYRSNFAYVGLPIIAMITEKDNLTAAIMVITFVLPMYNVLAVLLFNHYSRGTHKMTWEQEIASILKNPMIIGILLGLPFSLLHITMPAIMSTTLSNLGKIASPLGLLLIGASLRLDSFSRNWKGVALSSFMKIVFSPLVFTLLALPLHFSTEELVTVFTMHAVPSAVNSYVMTVRMGGDEETAAGIVMVTSLGSIITMTAGIYLLKQFGLA